MMTPPSTPDPSPRPDRDDEWIAIAIAFGVIAGAAAWMLVKSPLPQLSGPANPNSPSGTPSLSDTAPADAGAEGTDRSAGALGTQFYGALTPKPGAADLETGSASPDDTADRAGMPAFGRVFPALVPPRSSQGRDDASGSGATSDASGADAAEAGEGEQPAADREALSPLTSNAEGEAPTAAPSLVPSTAVGADPVQPPLAFSDLPADHWAKAYIDGLTARGVLAGFPDGTFAPDQPMTRAQFAAQLAQAFAPLPTQRSPQPFRDVAAETWSTPGINQAVALGFMRGYPEGTFQPDQTVPRVQVMAAIAAGLQVQVPGDPERVLANYPDQAAIPTWARAQTAAAIVASLAGPQPGVPLDPNRPATRAEVAAMLYQGLVYLGSVPPIQSR